MMVAENILIYEVDGAEGGCEGKSTCRSNDISKSSLLMPTYVKAVLSRL